MYRLYFSRIQINLSSLFMCPVCSIWTNRCRLVFFFFSALLKQSVYLFYVKHTLSFYIQLQQ